MIAQRSIPEKCFDGLNTLVLLALCFVTLYPIVYVLFASLSQPELLAKYRGILLWPLGGIRFGAYESVFNNPLIFISYFNTLFYTVIGTCVNMILTILGAFCLSRRNLLFGNAIMLFIVFTMFFNGGLIPTYLLINDLGMVDTRWALIVPGAINIWYLIIMLTSFKEVPMSLQESAKIDGANDFIILLRVILPLSLPVIAVMVLFYSVDHWNSYFSALIYLRDRALFPLQLILREILLQNNTQSMTMGVGTLDSLSLGETIKYATIMVATLPILLVYPFLQKYFVKGVMIGALKE